VILTGNTTCPVTPACGPSDDTEKGINPSPDRQRAQPAIPVSLSSTILTPRQLKTGLARDYSHPHLPLTELPKLIVWITRVDGECG
jgi:hypothetical protein